jgi:putative SOS response-associated peptidase YedK
MRFVLASTRERIEDRFNVKIEVSEIPKSYSVSSNDYTYVITCEKPHIIQPFKFGMTPFYATHPLGIILARAEGDKNKKNDPFYSGSLAIFLKDEFKKPIQSQRCLVIADAYYEWSDQNKPYLVYLQNKNRPFGFAGIYDRWQNPKTKEIIDSFAIITTPANSLLQSIGVKRMPVILSRSNERQWIKASNHLSDVLRMLLSYPSERMNAYPVCDMIRTPGMNDPVMLNPIGVKLQNELSPVKVQGYRSHKVKPQSDVSWFGNK